MPVLLVLVTLNVIILSIAFCRECWGRVAVDDRDWERELLRALQNVLALLAASPPIRGSLPPGNLHGGST